MGLLATGLYRAQTKAYAWFPWHKSFGLLVTLFVVWRVVWRLRNGWPAPVGRHTPAERLLATVVHYVLLVGTVLMPVSGFMASTVGGHGVDLFGIELVARNPDQVDPRVECRSTRRSRPSDTRRTS